MPGNLMIAICLFAAAPGTEARSPRADVTPQLRDPAVRFDAAVPADQQPDETIAYGSDQDQQIDLWRSRSPTPAPLIIFVHGGAWQHGSKQTATGRWKPDHYMGQGYNFASIDYRLVPKASVEDQASDVAAAVKALIDRADKYPFDRKKIILMGHSAGAHLVALVGTDPRYLEGVGLTMDDIRAVIALDGAAYDVPRQMREGPPVMRSNYDTVFGAELERQRKLSPTYQSAAPNVSAFLLPHVQRPDGIVQSESLAKALREKGVAAETLSVPGKGLAGHAEINRRMGDPSYAPTAAVDRWLQALLNK